MMRRALGLLVCLASIAGATCHGFLATPAARNVQHNSDYCPQCLNGPGVCGDQRGRHDHEAYGKHASPPRIAETYGAGGLLKAHVVFTANHWGRWSLSLCDLPDPSPRTERATVRGCFKRLKLAEGGSFVYLPPSASSSSAVFRLPRGVRCERCVVRWSYETGNSCTPPGTPHQHAGPGLSVCGASGAPAGEEFTNCADIRIR